MDDFTLTRTLDALQTVTDRLLTQHAALDRRFNRLQAAHQDALDRILVLETFAIQNYKENHQDEHTN